MKEIREILDNWQLGKINADDALLEIASIVDSYLEQES
jgi:hypothetical protein